jgi:hypothetical protein
MRRSNFALRLQPSIDAAALLNTKPDFGLKQARNIDINKSPY